MGNKKKKSQKSSTLSSPFLLVIIAIIVLGLGAGIAIAVLTGGDDSGGSGGSGIKIPDYAYSIQAPRGADKAYQFAVDSPEYLAAVPCYCGCGELEGHKSNLECFVKSRDGDKVEFDDHAYG